MKKIKKTTLIRISFLALVLLSLGSAAAEPILQQKSKMRSQRSSTDSTPVYSADYSRKIAILEADYPKVNQSFRFYFPETEIPMWIKNQNTLFVYFLMRGSRYMACFSEEGALLYSIGDFEKGQYPKNISKLLLSHYNNFSINHIKTIKTIETQFLEILLENKEEYIILHVIQEELRPFKRIRR